MRPHRLSILVCLLLIALPSVQVFSQSGFIDSMREFKNELKSYLSQLETIQSEIALNQDYEQISNEYLICTPQMDAFYEENKSFIQLKKQKDLSDLWSKILLSRKEIEKQLEDLKLKAQKEEQARDLEAALTATSLQYDQLSERFRKRALMKRKAANDTLDVLKKRDGELYQNYLTQKTQHAELIKQNDLLDSLCRRIESSHKAIDEAQNLKITNWGDIIFKVTIVTALLAFLINIIVSKKKLNNQLNGKKKKKKFTPSI